MTRRSSSATVKSLLTSSVSLLLCIIMLMGSTFAWFTDIVESKDNIIVTGNLDVELEYYTGGVWQPVTENTKLFDESTLWEPGHTEAVYLRVSNLGSLALKYMLGINIIDESGSVNVLGNDFMLSDYMKFGVINGVDTPFTTREEARNAVSSPISLSDSFYQQNALEPGDESDYLALVVYMPELVGNEANHAPDENPPRIQLGISLVATQGDFESDSFGPDYDADAVFPPINGNHVLILDVSGKVDASNQLTEDLSVGNPDDGIHATVPAGTLLDPGTTQLVLTVKATDRDGNISVTKGQASRSLDVHIEGIADGNTTPAIIDLGDIMPEELKDSSIILYHVENGAPVQMTAADTLTAHNQFVYDATSGNLSVAMATFSEVTAVVAVNNPWAGEIDTTWYNTTSTVFTITTEEELAGLGAIVGGMADGIEQDSFAGKTITLASDLDLGGLGGKAWYPIGYYFTEDNNGDGTVGDYYCTVYSFEGVFDGNGKTISNIYQSTWSMKGDDPHYDLSQNQYYNDGMGIFGFVLNGTVKNLTVNNFQSDGEFSTTGCVAAYAAGTSTFENINIVNSNPRAYNVPNGGVVGYAYEQSGYTNLINFNNVNVNSSNKVSALWGSWDVGCGGILGRVNGNTTINMTNCEVGAVIDVYNDVCGNYQYYQYRYSGMLIGTVGADRDSTEGPEKVNFSDVKVYIGNWADYYYCEFEKNSVGSYTDDFQFSRVERNEINIDPTTNLPYTQNLSPCRHHHTEKEDKMGTYLPFDQLYTGYSWGATAVKSAPGVEVIHYFYTVTYLDGQGNNVLGTEYVTDGERSSTKLWPNAHTVKSDSYTNLEGKTFAGWVNTNSEVVPTIAEGNYKDVILYESWQNPYVIRFVDIDGKVVYSEVWTSSNQGLSADPPTPPAIEGYVGSWELGWQDKLENVTADVTIKPVYILNEYAGNDDHIIADSNMTAAQLFEYLANGKSVIMSQDLSASGKADLAINGGKGTICTITSGKNARLNLNSFELTCEFDHNAKNNWCVFDITGEDAKLTISKGVGDDGVLVVNFPGIKSDVHLFEIGPGGKLVLEAGVKIEINYSKHQANNDVNVYGFFMKGESRSFDDYNGIYVDRSTAGKIIITVGVTTTITEDGVVQQNN